MNIIFHLFLLNASKSYSLNLELMKKVAVSLSVYLAVLLKLRKSVV